MPKLKELINDPFMIISILFFVTAILLSFTVQINEGYGFINNKLYIHIVFSCYAVIVGYYLGFIDGNIKEGIANHNSRFIFRVFTLSILPLLAFGFDLKSFAFILFSGSLFFPIFNISFNYFRDKRIGRRFIWYYIGVTSKIDKFLNLMINDKNQKIFKLKLLILYISLIIVSFTLTIIF